MQVQLYHWLLEDTIQCPNVDLLKTIRRSSNYYLDSCCDIISTLNTDLQMVAIVGESCQALELIVDKWATDLLAAQTKTKENQIQSQKNKLNK